MPIHDTELFSQSTAESRFIRNKQRKALLKSELYLAQNSNEVCQKVCFFYLRILSFKVHFLIELLILFIPTSVKNLLLIKALKSKSL